MSGAGLPVSLKARSLLPAPEKPGDLLRARFKAIGRASQAALAEALGVSRVTANGLLNGRSAITAVMALRLARIFDTTPEYWMDLQRDWDLHFAWAAHARDIEALPQLRIAHRVADMDRPISEIAADARRAGIRRGARTG